MLSFKIKIEQKCYGVGYAGPIINLVGDELGRRETCLIYKKMMLSLACAQSSSVAVVGRKVSDASRKGELEGSMFPVE